MNIHYDVTMNNDVAMCTYKGITMHNDIAMNLFLLCILCSMPNCVIFLWVIWNTHMNTFAFDQSGMENTFIVFV